MKNINFLLATSVTAAVVIGTLGFANFSNAESNSRLIAQNSSENMQNRGQGQGRRHQRPDFAAAAAQLGTTEEQLKQLLGVPERPPHPDFTEAASKLGVSEAQLRQALGITIDPETGEPNRPRNRPDLAQAASQLGVTEEAIKEALGRPEGGRGNRPRLDIAGTAAQLGVTEAQVIEALGLPTRPPGE
ncbi:MAG: hypothetical protein SAJ12_04520 [Jaaginema sp. PMC 1079.18]|nr:hypothetical protein [Jaaginema sp. PMC 1080.18]MEC4850255.1 hypothetical protein [Jaaginema sp. PMC 1079.18]MEC4867188.1 hypothetical protein [Jaaginema sp. PMC 1078.18]